MEMKPLPSIVIIACRVPLKTSGYVCLYVAEISIFLDFWTRARPKALGRSLGSLSGWRATGWSLQTWYPGVPHCVFHTMMIYLVGERQRRAKDENCRSRFSYPMCVEKRVRRNWGRKDP